MKKTGKVLTEDVGVWDDGDIEREQEPGRARRLKRKPLVIEMAPEDADELDDVAKEFERENKMGTSVGPSNVDTVFDYREMIK